MARSMFAAIGGLVAGLAVGSLLFQEAAPAETSESRTAPVLAPASESAVGAEPITGRVTDLEGEPSQSCTS